MRPRTPNDHYSAGLPFHLWPRALRPSKAATPARWTPQASAYLPLMPTSYTPLDDSKVPATICKAALATPAPTGFFDPISIGARQRVDVMLDANNPVDEVEGEAANIWSPGKGDMRPLAKCIVSFGTGHLSKKALEDNIINGMILQN